MFSLIALKVYKCCHCVVNLYNPPPYWVKISTQKTVDICLQDVNDNIPSFEKTQYDVIALREYQIGDIVLANITVTDLDPAVSLL